MQNSSAYDGLGSSSQFRGEGREGLDSAQPFPLGRVLAKDRIPCRAAVRGPSRSSTALNPEPTAQTDPRTRSRGITRVAVGAFSAMVVGGEEVGRDDRGIRSRTLKVQQRSVRKRSRGNGGRAGSCK